MEVIEALFDSIIEIIERFFIKIFGVIFGKKGKNPSAKSRITEDMIECKKFAKEPIYIGYSVNHKKMVRHQDPKDEKSNYFNTVIVGASRSGKTNLISGKIQNLIRIGHPFILIDPKADNILIQLYSDMAKLESRDLAIFSHRGDISNKVNYNPLRKGDLNAIVDRVINGLVWENSFYKGQCYRATHFCVESIMKNNRGIVDLPSLYNSLELLITDDKQCKRLSIKPDEITGIVNQLKKIVTSPYGKFLKEVPGQTINFSDAWDKGIILLIDLSVLKYPLIAQSINSFIISELLFTIGEKYENITVDSKKKLSPYHIILDEFGDVVVDNVIGIINKSLGVKLNTTIAMQTDSDVARVDKYLLERIKVNSQKKYIFNQSTEDSASSYASDIGTVDNEKLTTQIENGEDSTKGSKRESKTMKVHPDIIKQLGQGQCIVAQIFPLELHMMNTYFVDPEEVRNKALAFDRKQQIETKNSNELAIEEPLPKVSRSINTNSNDTLSEDGLF